MNVRISPCPILLLGCVCFLLLSTSAPAQTVARPPAFPERSSPRLVVPRITDLQLTGLLRTLDAQLAAEKNPARWGVAARVPLWNFGRQLQAGRLTAAQELRVVTHLNRIEEAHPAHGDALDGIRRMVRAQLPGKVAPDIVGKDLDGRDMRLSDLRGQVVVLMFSAEWCGICHTLNPYERFMLDLYAKWPFAIVSVETGESRESVKRVKSAASLKYRSWWDAPRADSAGEIATAWNALGFPSIYVLDQAGVIRFVDVRYEDLLKGVRQLLNEKDNRNDRGDKPVAD